MTITQWHVPVDDEKLLLGMQSSPATPKPIDKAEDARRQRLELYGPAGLTNRARTRSNDYGFDAREAGPRDLYRAWAPTSNVSRTMGLSRSDGPDPRIAPAKHLGSVRPRAIVPPIVSLLRHEIREGRRRSPQAYHVPRTQTMRAASRAPGTMDGQSVPTRGWETYWMEVRWSPARRGAPWAAAGAETKPRPP